MSSQSMRFSGRECNNFELPQGRDSTGQGRHREQFMECIPPRLERQYLFVERNPLLHLLPVIPVCRSSALNAHLGDVLLRIAASQGEEAKRLACLHCSRYRLRRLSILERLTRENDGELEKLSSRLDQCVQIFEQRLQSRTL